MKNYDLEERTTRFSEEVIAFCKGVPANHINKPMVSQLIRSATSIGANYHEANAASSKKDFKNKIHICKKEAQETQYWLRLIKQSEEKMKSRVEKLEDEAQQFVLIFGKIISTISNSLKN